jgi:ribonucleotide monophosphatase NagD (HAD superfamily)
MGILVLSGETKLSDIEQSDIKPDLIYGSLKEIGEDIK